jgi:hypothetical protein
MATFSITIVNQSFRASSNYELDSVGDANREAIKGALQIGVDEVSNGKPFFAAEVKIEQHEDVVSRFVVSIGASPLQ